MLTADGGILSFDAIEALSVLRCVSPATRTEIREVDLKLGDPLVATVTHAQISMVRDL